MTIGPGMTPKDVQNIFVVPSGKHHRARGVASKNKWKKMTNKSLLYYLCITCITCNILQQPLHHTLILVSTLTLLFKEDTWHLLVFHINISTNAYVPRTWHMHTANIMQGYK